MFKKKKTKVMKPLQFSNESVGVIQPMNQHQVHKDVADDKKVKMKDVFGKQPNKPKVSFAKKNKKR